MNIREIAMRGLPLNDILVIDCHCHMGLWHNIHVPRNNAEGMIECMNVLGVDTVCVSAHPAIGPNYHYGNDMVIDAIMRYPDRFVGYVTVNPNYEDDMENELKRCFAINGMKGIKLHPSAHGCPIDYKKYKTAYEIADKKKCPVLIHVWGMEAVKAIDRIAEKYPNAIFIMGHAGADILAMEHAIDIVNKHENVYVDLAISLTYEGNVEWFTKEMGSRKVLYGSDMPFFDPRPAFGRVAMADISDEDKRNILGLNMKRILGI